MQKKREWAAESNRKLPHLFTPDKTATLVPEFEVEDLTSTELQPGSCACSEGPTLVQNTLMMTSLSGHNIKNPFENPDGTDI